LSGNYALGRNIDAVSVSNFAPIGGAVAFTGQLDGQGHAIENLTIAPTSASIFNVGLFGSIGTGGLVKNLYLTNASVTADPNSAATTQNVGVLAGTNYGTIDGVNVTGTINGGPAVNLAVGGLVGMNASFALPNALQGTINNSSANVA